MNLKRHIGVREAPVSRPGSAIGRVRLVGKQARARLRRTTSTLAMAAGCGLLLPLAGGLSPVLAADYYWDTDGAVAGAGGATPSGTWVDTTTNLSTNVNGTSATGVVNTSTSDRLIFSAGTNASGPYTVNLDGSTQDISRLFFQDGTVTLTNGTINSGAGILTIDGTGDTIGATIAGPGVSFNGGSVTLTGTNTFTGAARLGGSLVASTVTLAASGGNAISGNLLQLGGNNYSSGGTVILGAANQINDTATVSMNSGHYSGSSVFSMNGYDDTIGGIQLHHQGNGSTVTFRNGATTDATVTLGGSGTYTTASGDRLGGRSIQDGGAGKLHVVVALTGAGSQTFAGTAPSYTGATTINSGTLRLWNTSGWASNTTLNGGTLNLHQTASGTPVTAGGNAATRTHARTIGGTGGTLRKTGDGTVILTGANTYEGATQIDQGTLRAGSATAFGVNSAVTLANVAGATMDLNNFDITIGSLAGGGTTGGNVTMGTGDLITGGNNTSTVYGGIISGSGSLTKVGTGTQTLSGNNIFTGGTTIVAGTLQLGNGGASGSILGDVANSGTLAFNRSNTYSFGGVISGTGGVSQIGPGTTVLTAGNTYQGGTIFDAGILEVSMDASLGNAAGVLTFDGGTLRTTGSFTTARTTTINAGGGTFETQTGTTLTQTGVVSGVGTLVKAGGGTLTLTNGSNAVSDVDINGGTLDIDGTLQTPILSIAAGGTLNVDGTVQDAGAAPVAVTGDAGINTIIVGSFGLLRANGDLGNGADVLDVVGALNTGVGILNLGDGDDSFVIHDATIVTGTVSGGAGIDTRVYDLTGVASVGALLEFEGLTKRGAGTLNLTGPTSELVNVRIEQGVVDIGLGAAVVNQLGQALNTTILGGATLNVAGAYGCATTNDSMDISGTVSGTGTIDLCAGNDTVTLNDGVALNSDISGGADTDTVVLNNALAMTFDATRTDNFEILLKQNSGVATINNSQTYSTRAEIQVGTLAVQGAITTPDFRILSSGTLMGTGRINGDVDNQGRIAPGNSIGTFLIDGNYAGGGTLDVEATFGDDGFPADLLLITGNATGVTTVNALNLSGAGAPTGFGPTDGSSIVQVGGTSLADAFSLSGSYVAVGPYEYVLNAFDPATSSAAERDPLLSAEGVTSFWDFRLQSDGTPVPQIAAYQALPSGVFEYGTQAFEALQGAGDRCGSENRLFLQTSGGHTAFSGNRGPDYDQTTGMTQAGIIPLLTELEGGGELCAGLAFSYGGLRIDVGNSSAAVGISSGGGALIAAYSEPGGLNLEGVAMVNSFSAKVTTAERGVVGGPEGLGAGVSVQASGSAGLFDGPMWDVSVEPVGRLSWQQAWFTPFTDVDGILASLQGGNSLRGVLGARVTALSEAPGGKHASLQLGGFVTQEFLEGEGINAAGVVFPTDLGGTGVRLDAALSLQVGDDVKFGIEAAYDIGLGRGTGDTVSATLRLEGTF